MILESPKRTQQQALVGTSLTHRKEKRHSKISVCSTNWCPVAGGSLSVATQRRTACFLLLGETSFPPPESGYWTDIPVGLAGCHHMCMVKQYDKCTVHPELGKVFPDKEEESGAKGQLSTRLQYRRKFQAQGSSWPILERDSGSHNGCFSHTGMSFFTWWQHLKRERIKMPYELGCSFRTHITLLLHIC